MSRKLLRFWDYIQRSVKFASLKAYQRILGLILLAPLALITTLYIPAVSAQLVEEISQVDSQTSNAQFLLQQGLELYEAEKYSQATEIFRQAASAFANQGDSLNQGLVLRYLSLAYQHLGELQEAEKAIANSFKLLNERQNTTNTQDYLDVFAKALNTQGRLQATKGQWSEALETWKKAAATYKKAGNETGVIGSAINQARALQALGLSSQAEAELTQVEQILLKQSDPNLKATGLQSLGEAFRRVGELKKSREVLQQSWAVVEREFQLSKVRGSTLLELANTERALGNRAIAIGNVKDAQEHIRDAIAYYQQATNSPNLRLQAELNWLSLLVETGKWSEAAQLGSTIHQSIASLPPSQTNIYSRLNFARSLTCLHPGLDKNSLSCSNSDRSLKLREGFSELSAVSLPEITQILTTAIQQARSLKDRRAESYAIGQLGGLYELTAQSSAAQDYTQQALVLAEEIQAPDIRYRWEWQMGRLWEKQGNLNRAIATYQEAVKTLKSVRSDLLTINSDEQFSFRDNVEPVHRKLVDLLLRAKGNSEPSQENLKQAIEAIDSLRLAELENFLNCNLSPTVRLTQDIDKIDRKAAYIYPIILEDRLAVISQLPGQPLKHSVTLVKQIEVEETASELRSNILKRNRPEDVIEKATRVYNWLIEPLEKDLENNSSEVKTVVFVLDGVLRNIPMSVLYDGKRQEYLMQKPYALAVVPGLQLFDLRPLQRERLKVLTAGVSEQRQFGVRKFEKLPNVVQELQQIKNIVPSESLLNPKFTGGNLEQQINSGAFSVVHIATHGKFSSNPEETFILTYDRLLDSNNLNNLLRVNNQSSSNIIELLVLSACETAKGDNRATLGLAGIAVRAGARSTLATLWQVSDRSTSELMEQFYKQLTKPELTKAEALHQAQLELFKQYKAPYYWAPYVLVGNWL
ncbi:CHAT domain-containing protein [Coleofasciculus sp. FACHB-64]|uniref:CHAT domain-containing protein n=1 Tax=Cyanophyceae TaxID=3028117 RepID=UPI00168225C1|nr:MULTISPECIES: CHAT domain-containing protein [unclassified Coleofasciculus]MBD1840734.1 CHAT domain-containing protein [Coleofasciculus sp. FACHB-501]MBD2045293.1 CHAT domain-containing protein [Coleofasciculus sp. FACHB-64]